MLWTQIRSIFDILESHPRENANTDHAHDIVFNDSFMESSWKWKYDEVKTDSEKPSRSSRASSTIVASIGPIKYIVPMRNHKDSDKNEDPPTWIDHNALDRLWGVSFGIDNMTFGDSQNRRLVTFETLLVGDVASRYFSENWAIIAGIQHYSGLGPDGVALTGRLAWIKPEIESALSIHIRALRLGREGLPAVWRPTIGGRIDIGFSSFLTSYLQAGRDFAAQREGRIRSGWSIGAGIQFGAPTCRIPIIKEMAVCD